MEHTRLTVDRLIMVPNNEASLLIELLFCLDTDSSKDKNHVAIFVYGQTRHLETYHIRRIAIPSLVADNLLALGRLYLEQGETEPARLFLVEAEREIRLPLQLELVEEALALQPDR